MEERHDQDVQAEADTSNNENEFGIFDLCASS